MGTVRVSSLDKKAPGILFHGVDTSYAHGDRICVIFSRMVCGSGKYALQTNIIKSLEVKQFDEVFPKWAEISAKWEAYALDETPLAQYAIIIEKETQIRC